MTKDLKNLSKKIEGALESNPNCRSNLILKNRVFFRTNNNDRELLVSLNNKSRRPHYWGHIFWHEGRYVACIVAVDYWLSPGSVEELFAEFWQNLSEYGWWYPVSGNVFAAAENFEEANRYLIEMIRGFDEEAQGEIDYRVVQVYPFPNPFKEYICNW
jgi:hypothetical protein